MVKRQHGYAKTDSRLPVSELEQYITGWLLDGEIRQLSVNMILLRKSVTSKLLWFLRREESMCCGRMELRGFLAHATNGHTEPGGRWGNIKYVSCKRPVKARTVKDYYIELRTLFNWIVEQGGIDASPVEMIKPPVCREDQIQPFSADQISALLAAAAKSDHPKRDEALVLLLLDTGMRVSELCHLARRDVDMQARSCRVLGKGNKERTLYYGATVAKALWAYLKEEARQPDEPLFVSERSDALTRNAVALMLRRLGKTAGVQQVRCSPHTLRHTFAVEFLRAGGQEFTLQTLMGHTSLVMTKRYVRFAEADISNQRQFSPADRLNAARRKKNA